MTREEAIEELSNSLKISNKEDTRFRELLKLSIRAIKVYGNAQKLLAKEQEEYDLIMGDGEYHQMPMAGGAIWALKKILEEE